MTKRYDIVIIGAGGGGITAAFEAQRRGARVALLEKHKIGGECTHSGCVPSKALIDIAKNYHAIQQSQKRRWSMSKVLLTESTPTNNPKDLMIWGLIPM